jgi:signal transduction histidine kinase
MEPQSSGKTAATTRAGDRSAGVSWVTLAVLALTVGAGTLAVGRWVEHRYQQQVAAARRRSASAMAGALADGAKAHLLAGDLSGLRRLIADTGRRYGLGHCRITLPNGAIVADLDAQMVSMAEPPSAWPSGTAPGLKESHTTPDLHREPIHLPGGGKAMLSLSVRSTAAQADWLARAGLGALAGVPLVLGVGGVLAVRKRYQGLSAIRRVLSAVPDGPADARLLTLAPGQGPEADAWNRVMNQMNELRQALAVDRACETLQHRRHSRSDLEGAFDAMSHGLVLLDGERRITCINGAAAVALQLDRDQATGKDIVELIEDEEVRKVLADSVRPSGTRRASVTCERGEGSSLIALRFTVRPVRKDDAAAAMITVEDITQQRVADQARNHFVAHATHELRTPLTNIRLYAESAIEDGEDDSALMAKCLNVINQETRRLERMVGEILSVSEMEAGSLRMESDDVRLADIFADLQRDYQVQAADKQIELTFDLSPKLPVLQGDRDKILMALHNLVGNALKYTPKGGTVTVEADVEGECFLMRVKDSGIGIGEGDREKIFETFYRADDPRVTEITGSGLGLPLARKVVRMHGGDITVEQSEKDQGTTFALRLPVQPEGVGV